MKKSRVLDIVIAVIYAAVLVVLGFSWKCKWDPVVTVIAVAVFVGFEVAAHKQRKKLQELEGTEK